MPSEQCQNFFNITNIYCDESCHLQHDEYPNMVLGALSCPKVKVREISDKIKELKEKHHIYRLYEVKWSKISKSRELFFLELVELFANTTYLTFRAVKSDDKSKLKHQAFNQTHDDWYYKMYYILLRYIIFKSNATIYNAYLDIKDSQGYKKIKCLNDILDAKMKDHRMCKIQHIRSHESQLLQLADILIGAVGYERRVECIKAKNPDFKPNETKIKICSRLKQVCNLQNFDTTTPNYMTKFNLFVWEAQ